MSTKTITMTFRNEDGSSIHSSQTYNDECAWPAIAYQFENFLLSLGYRLEAEDVGSDVGDFIASIKRNSEEW